jgi:hypothetical protein
VWSLAVVIAAPAFDGLVIGVKHFCLSATITFPYVLPHGECYRPVIS